MKKRALAILMAVLMLGNSLTVQASTQKLTKLGMTKLETDRWITRFAACMICDTASGEDLLKFEELMMADEYSAVYSTLARENKVEATVKEAVPVYCNASGTSTGDTVILVDMKVDYDAGYNIMYLVEVHVDQYGYIYGHNIWAL